MIKKYGKKRRKVMKIKKSESKNEQKKIYTNYKGN